MYYILIFNKEEVMKYYNVLEVKNVLFNKWKLWVLFIVSFIYEVFCLDLDLDYN